MGIIKKFAEGLAIALGIVAMFYLISQIGIEGIENFTKNIATKIGEMFMSIGD